MKKINVPVVIRRVTDRIYQDKKCIRLGVLNPYSIYPLQGKNPIVYSGGTGIDISLELELTKKFNARVFAFDPTKQAKSFADKSKNKNISFFPYGLAGKTGEFRIDDGEMHKCVSVSDFAKKHKHNKISLLKLDIEGFEYGVLKDVLNNPDLDINQITLEFHGWMQNIPRGLDRTWKKELMKKGYRLIYRDIDTFTYVKSGF